MKEILKEELTMMTKIENMDRKLRALEINNWFCTTAKKLCIMYLNGCKNR